jgi:glycosyltransferase involved in cell wall biosynthesis
MIRFSRRSGPTDASCELKPPAIAYVGSVVPNDKRYWNSAFSAAGSMFQTNLLLALKRAGLRIDPVLSFVPLPSFPRSKTVVVGPSSTELSNGLSIQLLPYINITPLKQLSIGAMTFLSLALWAWKHRREQRVIYSYNLTVPPGLFSWAAARLTRSKLVASLNDINVPGETVPGTWSTRLDYRLHRWLIPRLDGHVAVADAIMQDFAPERAFIRVEGGVTETVFQQTAVRSTSTDGTFTMVAAARLDASNGVQLLLDAFERVSEPRWRLIIAGSGPLEDAVKVAASRDPRITFAGFLPFEKVLQLYTRADLLLNIRATRTLHTRYFFPSKLMEYLASGTPVLTTDTGHVEQEFGDFVYLLRDESADAIIDSLRQIAALSGDERLARGSRAREYMQQSKTWDAQGKRLAQYIDGLTR